MGMGKREKDKVEGNTIKFNLKCTLYLVYFSEQAIHSPD